VESAGFVHKSRILHQFLWFYLVWLKPY
jgi:hypothetical protein